MRQQPQANLPLQLSDLPVKFQLDNLHSNFVEVSVWGVLICDFYWYIRPELKECFKQDVSVVSLILCFFIYIQKILFLTGIELKDFNLYHTNANTWPSLFFNVL